MGRHPPTSSCLGPRKRLPLPPRLLVVHTGGNDLLHLLAPLVPLLFVDILRLAAERAGWLASRRRPARCSFVGIISRRVGAR